MNSYYSATLYPLQDKVLDALEKLNTPFYLTGGTALARGYFNHRFSDDLDLFVNKDSQFVQRSKELYEFLSKNFDIEYTLRSESYVSTMVDKILKLEMVNDVAFREGEFQKTPIFSKTDNLRNILSNKISAIVSRDEPKDVVDIWIIAKNTEIKWPQVFQSVGSKAAGVFPPEVAKKLTEFPLELLDLIKWEAGQRPDTTVFKQDLENICDAILTSE